MWSSGRLLFDAAVLRCFAAAASLMPISSRCGSNPTATPPMRLMAAEHSSSTRVRVSVPPIERPGVDPVAKAGPTGSGHLIPEPHLVPEDAVLPGDFDVVLTPKAPGPSSTHTSRQAPDRSASACRTLRTSSCPRSRRDLAMVEGLERRRRRCAWCRRRVERGGAGGSAGLASRARGTGGDDHGQQANGRDRSQRRMNAHEFSCGYGPTAEPTAPDTDLRRLRRLRAQRGSRRADQ